MKKLMLALCLVAGFSVAQAADKANGEALVAKNNCASCHGAGMKAPISPEYPKLAGQHADYLYHALAAYQTADNPQVGRSNAIMQGQVKALSKKELKDIAAYIASLPGDLILKK